MIIRNYLFHRVSPETDNFWPPMKPALFEKIIRHLTTRYHVAGLEDWLEGDRKPSRKKMVTILFDDGYKDNIEYAAPILQKFHCPASFYVVTECINNNMPTWTYLLDHALQRTKIPLIKIDHEHAPENLKTVQTHSAMIGKIKPWMKKLSNGERVQVLNGILEQCTDVPLPQNTMMNWNDIRQLKQAGFHIGSHTHTHPLLAALESEAEIASELSTSASIIKENLGQAPLTISYPVGSFDQRVTRLAAETGYRYGLAVEQNFFKYNHDSLLEIPRTELHQEPWWKVSLRIRGTYQKARLLWQ